MKTQTLPRRNKYLNDLLMSKRNEAHEPKIGENVKRAKHKQRFLRTLRQEGFSVFSLC